ncbi:MAG TPA: hypothetical protein VFQ53_36850 [Kofleriaceae bacterium]|nr:hypothetical protein [Kofleriaceae bacterium]
MASLSSSSPVHRFLITLAVLAVAVPTSRAYAQSAPASDDDGFCDFVEGTAAAENALSVSPQVFGEFGRIEQPSNSTMAGFEPGTLRVIAGVRYRISGLYEASANSGRARAECRRHNALSQLRGQTTAAALAARVKVLDDALPEAEKILAQVGADLDARRTTAQEATATRLRVEELRRLSSDAHASLAELPKPSSGGSISAFYAADDDVEKYTAKLRRSRAFDFSVRAGLDDFLDDSGNTASPFFAAVSLNVNLGLLFQGGGNSRSADGRRRYVRSGRDPLSADATVDRLRALVEAATRRASETATLEADLTRQIEALDRVGGEEAKRYRQTVWFELIKVRAERAFHEAHAAALKQVLAGA